MENKNFGPKSTADNLTLERINSAFVNLGNIQNFPDTPQKQNLFINAIKNLFVQSSSILPQKKMEKIKKDILDLKPATKTIKSRRINFYSYLLENKLFEISVAISIELKPFLMGDFQNLNEDSKL